jgi:hypothetical protein
MRLIASRSASADVDASRCVAIAAASVASLSLLI